MKYIEKLKKEFNQATGLNNYELFIKWLNEKKLHLDRYSSVLNYLGLDSRDITIELDRGKFDTIILLDLYPIIEISNYSKTIDNYSLAKLDGKLVIKDSLKMILNERIDFMTYPEFDIADNYLVYLDEINRKIYDLAKLDKTIYYGFYGNIKDLDIKTKKRYLNEIKEKINYLRYNIASCETIINDTYVNILKIKKKL